VGGGPAYDCSIGEPTTERWALNRGAGGLVLPLATTRPDGRPHIAGVGAMWVEGTLYFVSGPGARKSRNLEQTPDALSRCRFRASTSSSRAPRSR